MKVRHFYPEEQTAADQPSGLVINLRHGKIRINSLLRWCSAGLIAAYLLTVAAGIHYYNQLALTFNWTPSLIIVLFVLLFINLLYIQNKYSEKRTDNSPTGGHAFELHRLYVERHYKNNRRLIGIYLVILLAGWLLLAGFFNSIQPVLMGFMLLTGLMLYGFGLLLIRNLLKEKCAIRRMIHQLQSF